MMKSTAGTQSHEEKLFAGLPQAEKAVEQGTDLALYQLTKRSSAFRMGYRYIVAPKSMRATYEASGAKIVKKHKPPVIVLPGDEPCE